MAEVISLVTFACFDTIFVRITFGAIVAVPGFSIKEICGLNPQDPWFRARSD